MRLILNESKVVKEAIEDKIYDKKKPTNIIRLLSKYYLSSGMNKPQTIEAIDKFFIERKQKDYNSVKWRNTIEKIVNGIHRKKDYELFDVGEINITDIELEKISELNNLKYEKVMFILLVYAKIYNKLNDNQKYWVNEELKYIFSDTKMTLKEVDQCKIIFELSQLGYIEVSKNVDCTNIHVLIANEDSESQIVINDFRNLIYYYLRWKGEKIIECEKCGKLIKPNNNKTKYCKECARETQLQWQRESMRKSRNCEVIENS